MTPKLTQKDIIILASNRQYSLKKFPDSYKSVDDKITLSCLICQYSWESTVRSYKNCKNGCQSFASLGPLKKRSFFIMGLTKRSFVYQP